MVPLMFPMTNRRVASPHRSMISRRLTLDALRIAVISAHLDDYRDPGPLLVVPTTEHVALPPPRTSFPEPPSVRRRMNANYKNAASAERRRHAAFGIRQTTCCKCAATDESDGWGEQIEGESRTGSGLGRGTKGDVSSVVATFGRCMATEQMTRQHRR